MAFIESSEFCIIYDKLLKVCQTEQSVTLEEHYPNICKILVQNGTDCKQVGPFLKMLCFQDRKCVTKNLYTDTSNIPQQQQKTHTIAGNHK